ncbi:integrase [Couchioplanes caeruleus]|uniref:Integrase n=1 Tax=Couchioplanes caeruleus TaxID=56438 RepID=A0A3N1GKH7_9ACTN|nr:integrase [Couchioplanes caeruleus]
MEIEESNRLRRAAIAEPTKIKGREARRRARSAIEAMPPFRRTTGPATRQHIKATLRAALNVAISLNLLTFNPAAHVEIDAVKRPTAVVWTAARVERWQESGLRPSPVMVWTPAQFGRFLDAISGDPPVLPLSCLRFRGLRRGELCGLRWEDVDLDAGTITVTTQLIEYAGEVHESDPKSEAGARIVALDTESIETFRRHRTCQIMARIDAGDAWIETGRVFTREDGSWLAPGWLSDYFERLIRRLGLPTIRLHDLRHLGATLAHAAGVTMKTIQAMLGHSSEHFTANTYTSVLPEVAVEAAEAAALIVPRQTPSGARSAPAGRRCIEEREGPRASASDETPAQGHYHPEPPDGIEPSTYALRVRRSSRLS